MNAARMTMIVLLVVLTTTASANDFEIDWSQVQIDCNRSKRTHREKINQNKGDEHKYDKEVIESVKITANLSSTMKDSITGLTLETFIIAETASNNPAARKPEVVDKRKISGILLERHKKVSFIAIETSLRVKDEAVVVKADRKTRIDREVSGKSYLGYVALLRDADGKLLFVRAENSKIRRIAEDLDILPKDIELDRKGVVQHRQEEKE